MKSTPTPPPARRRGVAAAIAVVVAGGGLAAGIVSADSVERAAEVSAPAVRLAIAEPDAAGDDDTGADETGDGGYLYPIETQPRCENLDNFGGDSKAFGSGGHQGVDIGAERGQEVYAVIDGVLYRQWTDPDTSAGLGWGLHGVDDTKFRYYHLDGFADGLEEGDEVERGQVIGYVGDTGNATPGGWHLHFEIRPGPAPHATPVDPNPLLDIPDDCTVYWR